MKKYKAIIYDIDGTLLDTLKMNMYPLMKIIKEETGEDWTFEQVLKFAAYPGMKVMEELGVKDQEKTYARWVQYVNDYEDGATLFEGFEEVQRGVEALSSSAEIGAINKKIFQRSADITEPKMKAHMARSADNSKSGRNGYRPPGHARDNIPKKVTTKKGEVGWELNGDAQNWFYMKFVEWGTSKMPPRDFLNNTKSECESEYHMIADQEYQKALNEKLGG